VDHNRLTDGRFEGMRGCNRSLRARRSVAGQSVAETADLEQQIAELEGDYEERQRKYAKYGR
jgi:hypothetical protein